MIKYFVQTQAPCKGCLRPSVDIVSTNEGEGLFYSMHFTKTGRDDRLSFCEFAGTEFDNKAMKALREAADKARK